MFAGYSELRSGCLGESNTVRYVETVESRRRIATSTAAREDSSVWDRALIGDEDDSFLETSMDCTRATSTPDSATWSRREWTDQVANTMRAHGVLVDIEWGDDGDDVGSNVIRAVGRGVRHIEISDGGSVDLGWQEDDGSFLTNQHIRLTADEELRERQIEDLAAMDSDAVSGQPRAVGKCHTMGTRRLTAFTEVPEL
jgi:hypothetical protein